LRQGTSPQSQHGIRWQREPAPCLGRAVQVDDRGRHGSCALSWWRARAHRLARRTGAGLLPHHCRIDRVYQGWQAACARSNDRDALGRAAGHPPVGEFLPGYEAGFWYGGGVPKNTPPEIVDKLKQTITAGLADPTIKGRLADLGGVPMPMSPAEFGKFIADETEKWAKVVKFSGAKPD